MQMMNVKKSNNDMFFLGKIFLFRKHENVWSFSC